MKYFKGKKIWITGASSGIGKELAIQLSKHTDKLILSSRKVAALESVKDLCENNSNIKILALDLEKHDKIEEIFNANLEWVKDVDILFNNAGISQRSYVEDTEFDVYKRLMDVNYLGTIRLSLLLLPFFKERNTGHFIVTSSVAGKIGVPIRAGYSASKFALHGFFEALRAELDKTAVEISMLCPGYIKTDISLNALKGDGSQQGTMDDAQANGMTVNTMVNKVLKAVSKQKAEILVGGIVETHLATRISRFFPSIFRKVIANSKVT